MSKLRPPGYFQGAYLRRHSRKWTASPLLKHPGLFFGKVTLATDVFYHKNSLLSSPPGGAYLFQTHSRGMGGLIETGAFLTGVLI